MINDEQLSSKNKNEAIRNNRFCTKEVKRKGQLFLFLSNILRKQTQRISFRFCAAWEREERIITPVALFIHEERAEPVKQRAA